MAFGNTEQKLFAIIFDGFDTLKKRFRLVSDFFRAQLIAIKPLKRKAYLIKFRSAISSEAQRPITWLIRSGMGRLI